MDYSAIAAQYGGTPVNAPPTDYADLARRFGGQQVGDKLPEAATRPEVSTPLGTLKTDPNESGFNLPAAVIGAGRRFDRIYQGLGQATLTAEGMFHNAVGNDALAQRYAEMLQSQSQNEDEKTAAYQQLQAVHPGSTEIGASAPLVAAPMAALPAIAGMEYGTPTERAINVGGALLGNKLAVAGGNIAAREFGRASQRATDNAAKNALQQPFRDANLVVPPAQANPSLVNQVLEGVSGGAKTEQMASVRNQPTINDLARSSLPGFQDENLTQATIRKYIGDGGKAYDDLKSAGPFTMDPQYQAEVAALRPSISSEVPELANAQIDNTIQALSKPQLSGDTAIELVKKLRYDAGVNFKNRIDPDKLALAQTQRSAADALEGAIERNLQATGDVDKLAAFQAARQNIAKGYTIKAALDSMGNVSAKDIAKQGEKKPLSGGLKTIADFADAYPKSAQTIDSATKANPFSVVDTFMSGLAASSTGHPALMGAMFARPAIRYGLLSGPYQRLMTRLPDSQPSGMLMKALQNPYAPRVGGLLGYQQAPQLAGLLASEPDAGR